MNSTNIFLSGVGGQGIGVLAEIILRASYYAGFTAKGVDTHGLAQRGGMVVSHIKLGKQIYSPLISEQEADIVISLEIYEALRSMRNYLKKNGTLIYYSTEWQPIDLRLHNKGRINEETIKEECSLYNINCFNVKQDNLPNRKLQNIAVLAEIIKHNVIEGITKDYYVKALKDVVNRDVLTENMNLLEKLLKD